jgi:hypothetical protein
MAMVVKALGGGEQWVYPIVMPVSDAKTNYWVVWAKYAQIQSLKRYEGARFKAPNKNGDEQRFSVVRWADRISFDAEAKAKVERDAAARRVAAFKPVRG